MNEQELTQFKELVIEWVKLDDLIRLKNNELKEIKNDKKSLEEYILESMGKLNESVIDISDGKLRMNKTTTKSPLKEVNIKEALTQLTNDSNKATLMTKHIFDSRPAVDRINLKRTFNRKNKDDTK